MTTRNNLRQRFCYLRSVCRDFEERLKLGAAISNGWSAEALSKLAQQVGIRNKEAAYRFAISKAASQRYVSDEEKAANKAELEALLAESEARRAIKATKDNRPTVPPAFKAFRAACQNMEDCDNLVTAIDGGWSALDLLTVAERFGRGVKGTPTLQTLRLAVSTSCGNDPGQHYLLR